MRNQNSQDKVVPDDRVLNRNLYIIKYYMYLQGVK